MRCPRGKYPISKSAAEYEEMMRMKDKWIFTTIRKTTDRIMIFRFNLDRSKPQSWPSRTVEYHYRGDDATQIYKDDGGWQENACCKFSSRSVVIRLDTLF